MSQILTKRDVNAPLRGFFTSLAYNTSLLETARSRFIGSGHDDSAPTISRTMFGV